MYKQIPIATLALILTFTGAGCISNSSTQTTTQEQNSSSTDEQTVTSETEYSIAEEDFLSEELVENIAPSALSETEEDGLIQMREEEKLARDVYNTLYEIWGLHIFSNIAQSEQTHTEAIKTLLNRYNLDDPVSNDVPGTFENPTIQTLYDQLIEEGAESLEAALIVGATIEDLDIYDLNELLKETDNEDIITVYQNLIRGSENHLRAFIRQLSRQKSTYSNQYISTEEFETIINNGNE